MRLQTVEAPCERPLAFCIMSLRVTQYGEVKVSAEAEAKASANSASSRPG